MSPSDEERFASMITLVATATGYKLDTPTIELYYRALNDVPIDLLEQASVPLVQAARFFPKVSEWRVAVDSLLDQRERTGELTAGNQLQLPGDVGEGRCPSCDDTGWVYLDVECDREWRCHQFVEGQPHAHQRVTRCVECKGKRDAKAESSRRFSRKPFWWDEKD